MVTKEMARMLPTVHQSEDMIQLKQYVMADDAKRYEGMAEGSLRLDVTHSNLQQRWHDILFHDTNTVMAVKEKLYRHGGTSVSAMELYLRKGGGNTVFLYDDDKTLAFYGARSGMEIHVKDTDPYSLSVNGGLEDVSQVEKYVMPDEEYDKMKNTVRAQRREAEAKKLAEQAAARAAGEEEEAESEAPKLRYELTQEELEAGFPIGGRCEVNPGGRRGTIKHAGHLIGTKGYWLGICLDEPTGHNDGSKDGKRYFDAPGPKYGIFVRPENVQVGDFPERDPFASDEEF